MLDTLWAVHLSGDVSVDGGALVEPMGLDGIAAHMPLLNEEVIDARSDDGGCLMLTIGTSTVRCDADQRYEAWRVRGPDGQGIVCMPGGRLAVWSARQP